MTVSGNLKEFIAAYLVEAEEHLAVANSQLLAIESAQNAGETHPRAVRETFRSLHTIKGLSAMVGIEPVVAIAHRMEAFLRDFDRSAQAIPHPAIDALLAGVRAIEQRVTAVGRGEPAAAPSSELLASLDSLALSALPKLPQKPGKLQLEPELLSKLAPFELDQLARGIAMGTKALRAEFSPSPERAARGLTINSVRERLTGLADIVRVLPRSVPVSPDAPGGLCFVLLLLTNTSDEALALAAGLEPGAFTRIQPSAVDAVATDAENIESAIEDDAGNEQSFGAQSRRGFVRVDVNRLDDAMEGLSALIVTRFRLSRAISGLQQRGVNTRELSEIVADNGRQLRDHRPRAHGTRERDLGASAAARARAAARDAAQSPARARERQRRTRQVRFRAPVSGDRAPRAQRRRPRHRNPRRTGTPR